MNPQPSANQRPDIVLKPKHQQALEQMLLDTPARYANPIFQFFQQVQAEAMQAQQPPAPAESRKERRERERNNLKTVPNETKPQAGQNGAQTGTPAT